MRTSAKGRAALTQEEGKRNVAYQDSRGVWTIGVGHTSAIGDPKVTPGLKLSDEEIDEILSRDLVITEKSINALVSVPLNQNQFDALVSLVYNIGAGAFAGSTVLKRLNAGNYDGAADAFLMWRRAGRDPNILLARRTRERKLFLTPDSIPTEKPVEAPPPVPATPVPETPRKGLLAWFLALLGRI